MLRKLLIPALLLFFSATVQAQEEKDDAKTIIRQVKESFILVRLQTSRKKIDLMKARGLDKEAEIATNEQYQENRETILSFENTFTFCPVYFFYAENSQEIREGKLEGHVFSGNQQMVEASRLTQRPFFTAEFAETKKMGISALVLMDQHMVPLEAPFPFYERKYIFFSLIKQSKARIAERYDARLKAYYDRHH